jgi:hypothetical protein
MAAPQSPYSEDRPVLNDRLAADLSAAASAGLAGATWIADLATITQLGATLVAIVAGAAAAWYHIEKAITERRNRED